MQVLKVLVDVVITSIVLIGFAAILFKGCEPPEFSEQAEALAATIDGLTEEKGAATFLMRFPDDALLVLLGKNSDAVYFMGEQGLKLPSVYTSEFDDAVGSLGAEPGTKYVIERREEFRESCGARACVCLCEDWQRVENVGVFEGEFCKGGTTCVPLQDVGVSVVGGVPLTGTEIDHVMLGGQAFYGGSEKYGPTKRREELIPLTIERWYDHIAVCFTPECFDRHMLEYAEREYGEEHPQQGLNLIVRRRLERGEVREAAYAVFAAEQVILEQETARELIEAMEKPEGHRFASLVEWVARSRGEKKGVKMWFVVEEQALQLLRLYKLAYKDDPERMKKYDSLLAIFAGFSGDARFLTEEFIGSVTSEKAFWFDLGRKNNLRAFVTEPQTAVIGESFEPVEGLELTVVEAGVDNSPASAYFPDGEYVRLAMQTEGGMQQVVISKAQGVIRPGLIAVFERFYEAGGLHVDVRFVKDKPEYFANVVDVVSTNGECNEGIDELCLYYFAGKLELAGVKRGGFGLGEYVGRNLPDKIGDWESELLALRAEIENFYSNSQHTAASAVKRSFVTAINAELADMFAALIVLQDHELEPSNQYYLTYQSYAEGLPSRNIPGSLPLVDL